MSKDIGLVSLIVKYNSALSDPQRIKMMKIMGSSPVNTVSVSDIARILEISQPATTKHLQILHAANLIERKRIGTSVFYSLNISTINEYHNLLETAFVKGFTPCPHGFKCEVCPDRLTCA
jgi:ArsR family transcriptional regulator, arsenate/arsenite/antimonite-responsive transcriptional repressor